jgi:16S rRNA (cytidine1402-2'-O)-methyltransferase
LGDLYIVATPIGNLEDITLRGLRVLGEVGLVAAEDTRTTGKLLSHFGIKVPLLSYNHHNAGQRLPRILSALETMDVALVSDAGVPVVSDPGHQLVQAVSQQGFRVVPIPGPSAVTAALSVAGLSADSFLFLGFLPRTQKGRLAVLHSVASLPQPLVIFEAPHRLRTSLRDTLAALGDRQVTVCREMTKLYEEIFRGRLSEAMAHFGLPRGEFVLVVWNGEPADPEPALAVDELRKELGSLKAKGITRRDAVAQVMPAHGVSRRHAYRVWLELPTP